MTAPLRIRRADTPPSDPVGQWLDVLGRMLPPDLGTDVREELESHVRERVRDLILAGQDEATAVGNAVAELGDAAAVAQRYRSAAQPPHRRRLMNLAIFSVAGAALMTSLFAVTRPGTPAPQHVYQPGQPMRVSVTPEPRVAALEMDKVKLGDAISRLAQSAKATPVIRWANLESAGLTPETTVTLDAPAGTISEVFAAINGTLAANALETVIDFRLREGTLEVARPIWFDQLETTLVRYDLSPIGDRGVADDEFIALVMQFVHPDDWKDNGGELAEFCVVGGESLFIKAPPRFHEGVRWFMNQLSEPARQGSAIQRRTVPDELSGSSVQRNGSELNLPIRFYNPLTTVVSGEIQLRDYNVINDRLRTDLAQLQLGLPQTVRVLALTDANAETTGAAIRSLLDHLGLNSLEVTIDAARNTVTLRGPSGEVEAGEALVWHIESLAKAQRTAR